MEISTAVIGFSALACGVIWDIVNQMKRRKVDYLRIAYPISFAERAARGNSGRSCDGALQAA